MERILTLIAILICTIAYTQTAKYGEMSGKDKYECYISKDGDLIKIGDTLIIENPSTDKGFYWIRQANLICASWLSGKSVKITGLKSWPESQATILNKPLGEYQMWLQFKGYGWEPCYISYEKALMAGEIINPNGRMTKEQAMAKLKEAKEKLDLQLITQQEYDKLKEELSPIIMK
jgi:hypothetical protein